MTPSVRATPSWPLEPPPPGAPLLSNAARAGAPATQSRLRDMAEVLNRIRGWAGSPEAAFAWYRSQPIPAFGDLTAEDLVKAGRAEALKRHLSRMAAGGYA